MAVKFVVILNGKELIAVARGNLIQELGEIANVALLMALEVGGYENDALVWQFVTYLASLPEADLEADAGLALASDEVEYMGVPYAAVVGTVADTFPGGVS